MQYILESQCFDDVPSMMNTMYANKCAKESPHVPFADLPEKERAEIHVLFFYEEFCIQ